MVNNKNLVSLDMGDKLKNLEGHIPDTVMLEIPETMKKFQVDTTLRVAHFLAQCGHESGGFKHIRENLNYSAAALRSVFGKYFPTLELAEEYARQPEKIANKVYANRMGNGPEDSGDGWRFRGRGYIQLTGKNNYTHFQVAVGSNLLNNPDLVATSFPLLSAGWFWQTNKLNQLADKGTTEEVIKQVTRRINGGYNGLEDRIKKFNVYFKLIVG